MIPTFALRSILFNLLFYIVTGISCILLLPTLFLPRKAYLAVVHYFVRTTAFLEKYILGLTYEVRGVENIPEKGSFLVASKHQSAYETTKLHILFNDPAIVLKKELLKIPLWGWYLAKSDVIAIDRSTPKTAVESVQNGAKKMAAQGRPIIIFPQGTRVLPQTTIETRPYKIGIVRMQEATGLPIIPLALNTGVFWPRSSFFIKPGRVVFEFLPPILAGGKDSETLQKIQNDVEKKSIALMQEGRESIPKNPSFLKILSILSLVVIGAWCLNWFIAAAITKNAVSQFIEESKNNPDLAGSQFSELSIRGFPYKLKLVFGPQKIINNSAIIDIESLEIKSWPFLNFTLTVQSGVIKITAGNWATPITYDNFHGLFSSKDEILTIDYAALNKGDFTGSVRGTVDFNATYPKLDLTINLKNHETLLKELTSSGAADQKAINMAEVTLGSIKDDQGVTLKVTSRDRNVYLGPFRVYQFPDQSTSPAMLENGQSSRIATRRQKPENAP